MSATATNVISGAYAGQRTYAGVPSDGTSEIQTLTVGGTPTGGTFYLLTDAGHYSPSITWSATNNTLIANVQTALDSLFGSGNCTAADSTLSSGIGALTMTFGGDYAKLNMPLMTTSSSLTGTAPTVAVTTTTAGVTATHRGAPTGATIQDTTNGDLYVNQGSAASPQWALVATV